MAATGMAILLLTFPFGGVSDGCYTTSAHEDRATPPASPPNRTLSLRHHHRGVYPATPLPIPIADQQMRRPRSAHVYRGLPELTYPFHDHTIMVTQCGRICFNGQKINLSHVFAGQGVLA
jgi:hypothetical protein